MKNTKHSVTLHQPDGSTLVLGLLAGETPTEAIKAAAKAMRGTLNRLELPGYIVSCGIEKIPLEGIKL